MVVVLAGAGSAAYWWKHHTPEVPALALVDVVDPKLSDDEKKPFYDRIAGYQDKLNKLDKNAPIAERYQLLLSLASEYYPIGELKKSYEYYSQASKLEPNEAVPYYSMSQIAAQRGDVQSALALAKKSTDLEPTDGTYWRARIELERTRNGLAGDALDALFKEAVQQSNDDINVTTIYAQFLEERKDLVGAVEQWKKAIEKYPINKDVYQKEIDRLRNQLQ